MADINVERKRRSMVPLLLALLLVAVIAAAAWWYLGSQEPDTADATPAPAPEVYSPPATAAPLTTDSAARLPGDTMGSTTTPRY